MKLPFHATSSEQRIIGELLAIARRRATTAPAPDKVAGAARYIETLEEFLFPETWALIKKRAALINELETSFAHASFDRDLETADIRLNATIRNESEYRELVERLQRFDFSAWASHCAAERQYAD